MGQCCVICSSSLFPTQCMIPDLEFCSNGSGLFLDVSWLDIRKFERRVTDALEMQQAADKENWDEQDHMVSRAKAAKKKRLMMIGMATVGGGLIIGLSAGLLAPVIGAGLAAVSSLSLACACARLIRSRFHNHWRERNGHILAGAGGAAIVSSAGVASGGTVAARAANKRTGVVKTFEYRPLHNHKRVNLIVTVAG
ncbi:hypothetical protein MRB53_036910 [Persea americana]|nr:hypothetical protein MRB53_036910 [Persea americana]